MSDHAARSGTRPHVRQFGRVNWLGFQTLYVKEVRRFFKVSVQTVLAPAVQALLFMAVLMLAWGESRGAVLGVSFGQFLAPGLVMMSVLGNAFANSSSSLIVSKLQGNSVDFLMAPLSPGELAGAFVAGAATRGVVVGVAAALVVFPFAATTPKVWWAVLYFPIAAGVMMGAVGAIAGVWAEKFDHLAAITNFIITPLTFLSGTFYSVSILPPALEAISHWNPFFHAIDGFRYGVLGVSDASPFLAALVLLVIDVILVAVLYWAVRTGWRLKS